MGERSYTVAEIDRMRSAVHALLMPKHGSQFDYSNLEEKVELRLRTYLEAGISPDDLADHVRTVRPSVCKR